MGAITRLPWYLFGLRQSTHGLYGRVHGRLQEDLQQGGPSWCYQCPRPYGEILPNHTSTESSLTLAGYLVESLVGSLLLSSASWWMQDFVCALQDWSLCFPKSCVNPIIKCHSPSRPDSLDIPSPLVKFPRWKSWIGFRTFTTVGELLWYYCSPVCGSPTQKIWDLILSWLCPSYSLVAVSSVSLDVGSFFGGFQRPPIDGCSTASCNSGAQLSL